MGVAASVARVVRGVAVSAAWCALVAGQVARAAENSEAQLVEKRFAPSERPGPRGATMFTELAPSATGVVTENRYADPKMWGERFQEYFLGSIGTGLAIGDYDNDGRPDLFVVSKTESCRLFRNLGDWKFADVTEDAGVSGSASGWAATLKSWVGLGDEGGDSIEAWKQGAAFVDVNNDGWLDLYVCRFRAANWLFINQGDGTFKEEAAARGLAVVDASCMGAFCDYDRDGWLDAYLQTNMLDAAAQPGGRRDYLFRNNRDGTFTDFTERAGITGENLAHSATWWDFDEDGWPDIHVANDFGPPDRLYRNNRDGTFTDVIHDVAPALPYSSMGADIGDVDNDGRLDLMTTDMAATSHEKDQRGMADTRTGSPENAAAPVPAPQFPRNHLFLNTGTGRLLEAAYLAGVAATDWTWSVRLEDLDNDGRVDLHVTNGMNREHHNADLRERIYIAENPVERVRVMQASPVLAETNRAFRNRGDLRFDDVAAAWGLAQTGVSFGAAFGDFDGDGDLDLALANYEAGVTLLRNDCVTGHRVIVALRGSVSNRFGVGATVRLASASGEQVRALVLARGYLSSSEPVLHFGLGEDARVDRLTVSWPSGHTQTFVDLAVDRHFTITEPAAAGTVAGVADLGPASARPATTSGRFLDVSEAANLSLLVPEGPAEEKSSQPFMPVRFNRRGPALAVGDLDGDGRDDVVLGGTTETPARILRAGVDGRFTGASAFAATGKSPLDDGPALIFDANGDGHADVLLTRGGASLPAGATEYQPGLWLGDGRGGFRPAPAGAIPPLAVSAGAAVAADFDRDGRLDVFIGTRVLPGRYPAAPRSALLLNRGGTFEDATDQFAPGMREVGMVTSALGTDIDDDGWLDLLIALEWGGVRCWRNRDGRGFDDWSERAGFAAAGGGWWSSLAAADFNGDGRPDYVAGNVGLNTRYHASAERPAVLFLGDFKGGGGSQLIEGYYEGDRLYPWRTRKELGAVIPALLRRFPKNDAYARATLEEILGQDRLAKAQRFAATELASGVFLSQKDGSFRFVALPRVMQIAPMQGVVAGDFDGDGRADICAVQNSRAWTAERFESGLSQLLLGDGRGGFTPAPPVESGLVVDGDAKALVVLDLDQDGWPDLFASRNQGTTRACRNNGVAGRSSLRVVLRGPAGNPTAIGARVTAVLGDGSTQTAEVGAGAGYYSQSPAACFFGARASNPIRALRVRWPSGRTTTHDVTAAGGTVTLSAPPP